MVIEIIGGGGILHYMHKSSFLNPPQLPFLHLLSNPSLSFHFPTSLPIPLHLTRPFTPFNFHPIKPFSTLLSLSNPFLLSSNLLAWSPDRKIFEMPNACPYVWMYSGDLYTGHVSKFTCFTRSTSWRLHQKRDNMEHWNSCFPLPCGWNVRV